MTPAVLVVRKAGVEHHLLEYTHDPSAASYGREAADVLGLAPECVFKTLVADVEGQGLVCALVPVVQSLDLKRLAEALGARRARMADPGAAERATGYVLGGISPLGQRKVLKTVVDVSALLHATVYVSAGRRGLELGLSPKELVRLAGARTAVIARD